MALVPVGEMQWLINLNSQGINQGASGGQTETFILLHQVFAKKEETGRVSSESDEDFEDGLLLATDTAYFTFNHVDNIDTNVQVEMVEGGETYDILTVNEIGFKRQIVVKAVLRSNDND